VFQLTRHWSGLLGGDQGEARVGLPPLNCAVILLRLVGVGSSCQVIGWCLTSSQNKQTDKD
jgi:hypothetical protein